MRGNRLSATGQGALIPETSEVSVVPTVKDVSGLTPGITLYPLPATLIVNSGTTTITADLSSLRPGTYSLKLESVEGANPFFSVLLFDSFEVPGDGSSGGGDESLTPGWSSDAGGCDAGFAGLALLVAGSLLAIRKGSKR